MSRTTPEQLADSRRIGNLDVANDHQTVLVTIELDNGKMDALLLRWVVHESRLDT